ncbi:hypothetical protein [Fischerella sp. PCC 9605]|uniref:hypothetical protein n=1 Tax=Fischerella sp. PCC 9605 TaxID=1173024 RepID=UPI00047AFBB4|nr:hypothetical protein [Fischerella sp. PCC 9605]
MNQVLTLVVRLQTDPKQYAKLKDTATEFASCCEFINSSVKPSLTNRNSIQAVIYNDARKMNSQGIEQSVDGLTLGHFISCEFF